METWVEVTESKGTARLGTSTCSLSDKLAGAKLKEPLNSESWQTVEILLGVGVTESKGGSHRQVWEQRQGFGREQ